MSIILLAVIVSVISQILGFVWFGPLFGKKWMAATGHTGMAPSKKVMAVSMLINFIASAIMAFVLFDFLAVFGAFSIPGALLISAFLFVGFVLPMIVSGSLWNSQSVKNKFISFGLSFGFQIINMAIWAVLFGWLK